jgi:hypothetical protein
VYENAAATTTTIITATASNNNTTGAAHQGGGAGEAAGAAAGGGADKQQQKRRKQRMVGTVGYMAPEVIRDRLYSPAADVFSTGVVLYTLLVGYPPFPGREDQEVLQNTVRGNYRMDPRRGWGEVSDEAQALVKRLLDPNPATRITTTEALASPWLSRGRPWSEAELQQYQEEQEEKEGAMRMGAGCAGSSSAAASSAAAAGVGASLSSSPTMSPLLSPLSSSSSPSSPLSLSPRQQQQQQQQQQHGVAPVARHLSGVSAALAAQLPMLRRSQESLREYNDQRITVRISRAADFVFNLDAAALDGSDETVGGSNNGGESSPGGGGGGADGGAGHAAGAGAGGGGAGSSSKPSGPGSLVEGMSLTGESGSGGGGGGGGSGAGGDDSGSSVVVNLQAPQIRKRVERAFRLLSPFNGGRLSPMRFQLLARVVNAGHWPPAPLFAFFDRDRDGCVSTEDFTAAQALIRTRSPDFIYLLFQAYLAALPTSKAAVNAANNNAAEHAGGMAEGEEGEEEEEEDGGGESGEEDEGPGGNGAGGGDGGGCGNGDDIFGGGGSTQGVSPGMLRGMRQQQQQNNSGGGGRRQRQRGGTVDMTSSVTREHVRAMFRARLPFVGSGSEGEATRQQHEKMADKAFDAAVKAVFGDDAPSRSPRQQPSQLGSLVTALDTPSPSLAPSGGPPAPPPLALDAPSPPATPDSKQRRGLGAGVSSVEVPNSPSQDVWENRMGDLLPSKLSSSFAALGVDDASPAFEGGQEEIEPAVGFRFPQFRKASLAVPILCEVMLMETRKHAMRAVGNSDRDATPLVDSVIKEEETD